MTMGQAQVEDASSTRTSFGLPARRRRGARPVAVKSRLLESLRTFAPIFFAYFAALADAVVIFASAYFSNVLYSLVALGYMPPLQSIASFGLAVALLVVGAGVQRGEYALQSCLRKKSGQATRAFGVWNLGFTVFLGLGFATKTTSDFSRGATIVFYVVGYISLFLTRRILVDLAAFMLEKRVASPRRLVIVGFEDRMAEIERSDFSSAKGVDVVAMIALRDHQACLADDLALAAAAVRVHRADDVCLAIPWSRHEVFESCFAAFLRTPAEIHLDAARLFDRFSEARTVELGPVSGLLLTRPRLTLLQRMEKRLFDIAFAGLALTALAPFLFAVALMIRIDSKGPALFRQTRYGFNQEPFRIFKFRTMRTMEDGAKVVSAKRDDPRVTRLGRFLRSASIDELPQLINVLRGEMSIVGPRPHAMAHDQRYVERLSRYARRHNVKPGITGWAQVHGHRGEITNDQQMLARLEHDLYYVDNWSLWLDIKIVFMTVFSRKARSNAF